MRSSLPEARSNSSDSEQEGEAAATLSPVAKELGTSFLFGVCAGVGGPRVYSVRPRPPFDSPLVLVGCVSAVGKFSQQCEDCILNGVGRAREKWGPGGGRCPRIGFTVELCPGTPEILSGAAGGAAERGWGRL